MLSVVAVYLFLKVLLYNFIHLPDTFLPFLGGFYFLVLVSGICPFGDLFAPFLDSSVAGRPCGVYVLFGNRVVSVNHIIHDANVFNVMMLLQPCREKVPVTFTFS